MTELTVDKVPCKSCPYRKDVPSGVWSAEEYDKLPAYDEDAPFTMAKLTHFDCHQRTGKLCAGWVGCHGGRNLLGLRMAISQDHTVADEVWNYVSPIALWESGKAAAEHGKKHIKRPLAAAKRMVSTLVRKRDREGWGG